MDVVTVVTIEEITQNTKGNNDREAIIIEELKTYLEGVLSKGDKKKEQKDRKMDRKVDQKKKDRSLFGRSSFGL